MTKREKPTAERLASIIAGAIGHRVAVFREAEFDTFEISIDDLQALLDAVQARAFPPVAPAGDREAVAREAKMHVVNLEQCSLFVDSDPIKRAMTDAAAFIKATPPAQPAEERAVVDAAMAWWRMTSESGGHNELIRTCAALDRARAGSEG